MAVQNRLLGQVDPIVWFENEKGEILWMDSTKNARLFKNSLRKRGYELMEAKTWGEILKLQKRLQQIEHERLQREIEREERWYSSPNSPRQRLYATMLRPSTPDFEKEAIRTHLADQDKKREKRLKEIANEASYLNIVEFDSRNHIMESVDNVPDAKDVACKKCGKARKFSGQDFCLSCLAALEEQAHGA